MIRRRLWSSLVAFGICVAATTIAAHPETKNVDVYMFRDATSPTQKCARQNDEDRKTAWPEVLRLIGSKLPTNYHQNPNYVVDYDPLLHYIGLTRPIDVLLVSYCKRGDIFNFSMIDYTFTPGKATKTNSWMTGTPDLLATMDWSKFPAPVVTPGPLLVSNIAFLPIQNDTTNTVNAELLHTLPLTVIATPAPLPTASPATGIAPTPMTPLQACTQSGERMLLIGRTVVQNTAAGNDTLKLIGGAAAISQSAPGPWGGIYTALGVAASQLYSPNSADVSADVLTCDDDTTLTWIGSHPITGHASTPLFNASPVQVQRALDGATSDLINQLYCIIAQKRREAVVNGGASVFQLGAYKRTIQIPPAAQKFQAWCKDYYYGPDMHSGLNATTQPLQVDLISNGPAPLMDATLDTTLMR